ncbi:MAG: hypothetical protein RBR67_10215 [Desulfobacterium sp.]|jgi:hypothetical protein|nr:hypothetical protein [Desulfobacterium sp.]
MKKIVLLLSLLTMVTGCSSARISSQLSAGILPCRPNDIIITEETSSTISGMHNWVAECNGKRYICSYHHGDGVSCTEEIGSQTMIANLKDMLKSDLMKVKKEAAKRITTRSYTDQDLYEVVNEELLKGYQTASDKVSIDTMAWLCKALGTSGNEKYKDTLQKVKNSDNRKLARSAVIGYDMLK